MTLSACIPPNRGMTANCILYTIYTTGRRGCEKSGQWPFRFPAAERRNPQSASGEDADMPGVCHRWRMRPPGSDENLDVLLKIATP